MRHYAVPAFAGLPFATDDPEPVHYHHWEVNYGATFVHIAGGSAGSLPGLDINVGLYPGVQLYAQPQMAYARHDGMLRNWASMKYRARNSDEVCFGGDTEPSGR